MNKIYMLGLSFPICSLKKMPLDLKASCIHCRSIFGIEYKCYKVKKNFTYQMKVTMFISQTATLIQFINQLYFQAITIFLHSRIANLLQS